MIRLLCILSFVFAASAGAEEPRMYSSRSLDGRVVDAATGKPIDGAVVVARWLVSPSFGGNGIYLERLHIAESVTDAAGRYSLPAWGPKAVPPMRVMDETNPHLAIFKTGYWPLRLDERGDDKSEKIVLKPFDGNLEQRAQSDFRFYVDLRRGTEDDFHDWINYPRTTAALCDEDKALQRQHVVTRFMLPRGKELRDPPALADAETIRRCEDAP